MSKTNEYKEQVETVVANFRANGFTITEKSNDLLTEYTIDLPKLAAKLQVSYFNDAQYGNYQVSLLGKDHGSTTSPFNTTPVAQAVNDAFATWNVDYSAGLEQVHRLVEAELRKE